MGFVIVLITFFWQIILFIMCGWGGSWGSRSLKINISKELAEKAEKDPVLSQKLVDKYVEELKKLAKQDPNQYESVINDKLSKLVPTLKQIFTKMGNQTNDSDKVKKSGLISVDDLLDCMPLMLENFGTIIICSLICLLICYLVKSK